MSESSINNYERRLNQKDVVINRLLEKNAMLEDEARQLNRKCEEQTEMIEEKAREIQKKGRETERLQQTIDKMKGMFEEGEQRYKELFSTAVELSQPGKAEMAMLVKHHGVELYLKHTKLQIQQEEFNNLSILIERKNQTIAKLLAQNNRLRQHELTITSQYFNKIQTIKTQMSKTHQQPGGGLILPQQRAIEQTQNEIQDAYEQILNLKDSQIANLRVQYKSSKAEIQQLLTKIRELEKKKEQSQNVLFETGFSFDELLIENANLKEENEKAKKDLDYLKKGIPDLEQFKTKVEKHLKNKQKWASLEKRVAELETEVSLAEGKYRLELDIAKNQIQRLRSRESQLTRQNIDLELIIEKLNQAFKIMNPYFDIYKYDLAGLSVNEVNRIRALEAQTQLAVRINEFKAKEKALQTQKESYDGQLAKAKRDSIDLRKELTFYKGIVKTNFNITDQNSPGKGQSQMQVEDNATKPSHIQWKCIQIIRELVNKIKPLQRQNHELNVKYNFLLSDYELLKNQITPRIHTFVNTIALPSVITLQQTTMPNPDTTTRDQLTQITSEVTKLKFSLTESQSTLSKYSRYIEDMKSASALLKQSQSSLTEERNKLRKQLESNSKELQELKNKAMVPSQPEPRESAPLPDRVHSQLSIPELEDRSSISEESVKRLSDLIQCNVLLLDRMQKQYMTLKSNYERTSQALLSAQGTLSQQTLLQNSLLKQKLSQASARLSSSDTHQKTLLEQNSLLKQQNTRLLQSITDIEQSRQRQHQIQKIRQQAILSEVKANLEQREGILMSSYAPGLDQAGDAKLIKALTQLIQDKNKRIDVLEQRLVESGKVVEKISEQNVLTVNEQDNLAELLDRAAQMIEALQRRE